MQEDPGWTVEDPEVARKEEQQHPPRPGTTTSFNDTSVESLVRTYAVGVVPLPMFVSAGDRSAFEGEMFVQEARHEGWVDEEANAVRLDAWWFRRGHIERARGVHFRAAPDCGVTTRVRDFRVDPYHIETARFERLAFLVAPQAFSFQHMLDAAMPKFAQAAWVLARERLEGREFPIMVEQEEGWVPVEQMWEWLGVQTVPWEGWRVAYEVGAYLCLPCRICVLLTHSCRR